MANKDKMNLSEWSKIYDEMFKDINKRREELKPSVEALKKRNKSSIFIFKEK